MFVFILYHPDKSWRWLLIIALKSSSAEHPREMATQLAQDVGGPFVLGGSQSQRARPGMEDCCQHINHSTIMCFPQELLTKYIWSWARHMAVIQLKRS